MMPISASEDRHHETVVDLIRDDVFPGQVRKDLFPVGRLDKDTEGLLIITNDGKLAHRLLAPRHHIDKAYYAVVTGIVGDEDIEKFKKGQNSSKVLINYLFLSSIKLYLTIRLNLNEIASGSFSNIFAHIFGSIGNTLARFTDVPIYFTEKGFENIYTSLSDIFSIIYREYKGQGTAQIL